MKFKKLLVRTDLTKRNRMKRFLTIFLFLCCNHLILANVPQTFHFQGALQSISASPVNQSMDFTFRIYDQEANGYLLWEETHYAVEVNNGIFNVQLGNGISFPESLFEQEDLWITFRVSGEMDEMQPRQKLLSVPYSMKAKHAYQSAVADTANTLSGKPITEFVVKDSTGNASINGTLTASSFSGDGSGLTNIPGINDSLYIHSTGPDTLIASSTLPALTIKNCNQDGYGLSIAGNTGFLSNSTGIVIDSTDFGVRILNAENTGYIVNNSNGDGINIGFVTDDGLVIDMAGNVNILSYDPWHSNGIEVAGAEGYGMYIGNALQGGIYSEAIGSPNSSYSSTTKNGFTVTGAEGHGLFVGASDLDGILIKQAGNPTTTYSHSNIAGIEIEGASGAGVIVGHADTTGVYVKSATQVAFEQNNSEYAFYSQYSSTAGIWIYDTAGTGVYSNTSESNGEYGVYTPDKIYGSNVTSKSMNTLCKNMGESELTAGDIVCLKNGFGRYDDEEDETPICYVEKNTKHNSEHVFGVVEYQLIEKQVKIQRLEGTEICTMMIKSELPARKGGILSVRILGPTKVKVNSDNSIQAGEKVIAEANTIRKIKTTKINGIKISENTSILGKAMENSAGKSEIMVFINPK